MKELYDIFRVRWERPLKWYEYLLVCWFGLSVCGLAIDIDTIPIWAVALITGNLLLSAWISGKVLPDIKDLDDEFNDDTEDKQ
jgi:4-hydroxybenzoate polyprenyltransferase